MGPETVFDSRTNELASGLQPLVVHCHFYNCALQAAIEASMGDAAPALLVESARRVVRAQLAGLKIAPEHALATGAEVFRTLGFGTLDFSKVDAGEVVLRNSHYAMGWVASHGTRREPVCYFAAGFVAATAELRSQGTVIVHESRCYVSGAEECTFSLKLPD